MTEAQIEQYFEYHNKNIRLIKISFEEIRDQIKSLYKKINKDGNLIFALENAHPEKVKLRQTELAFYRLLSGIQVSWAEESIKRLFYEKNLFSNAQRDYLIERPALDQKWYKTLKIVFCIAYDLVPQNDPVCNNVNISRERRNLGDELVDQYRSLKKIITDQLVPNFTIRNKVQHGEWLIAFKPKYSKEFSQNLTDKINGENIITATSRFTIVNAVYQMLVDMGRFKSDNFALDSITTPFEYFYNQYLRKINFEVQKIQNADLELFINDIVEKENRGLQYRAIGARQT